MKAAVLHGNEDLRFEEFPEPELTPGKVKVKVKATGICGSDVPRVLHNGAHFYPVVLGHEFSGEVVACGDGVTKVKVGDRVSGAPLLPCMKCEDCQHGNHALCKHYSFIGSREQGSFAEFVVLPEANAVPFDSSISWEQGAMFEPSAVALHGLWQNDFRAGGRVAVLGGGTIGLFAMQWAKVFGAKKVTVFDISPERLALAQRLGADETVLLFTENQQNLEHHSQNSGVFDYIFETAGVTNTMQLAFFLAANKARVCFIGTPTHDLSFCPKLWENLNRKEFFLTGSWMSYSAPFPGKEWELTAHYFATGQLKFDSDLIFKKFPLSQAADAFSLYKIPGSVKGKLLLLP